MQSVRSHIASSLCQLAHIHTPATLQLVFSSTCAVYGNPEKLPVTEETPPKPINPYGEAKLMSERVIQDYMHAYPSFSAVIFRYFNVYGSDPQALLGEWPRPELRQHSRISGACLDAAMHEIEALTITGVHPLRELPLLEVSDSETYL
jgi:UDP-arabinose 4-epimerase